jgi:hypothetical protein
LNYNRTVIIVILVVVLIGSSFTTVFFLASRGRTTAPTTLPGGCVKPPGGFLVIASIQGYNDSIEHGVPKSQWPIITVQQGQTVNITVCNTDVEAHGFQVSYYYASSLVTLAPGQVLHVSFVADKLGEFRIYCNIFCAIHWAMQSGLLNVTAA